jgi:hypothetical protein
LDEIHACAHDTKMQVDCNPYLPRQSLIANLPSSRVPVHATYMLKSRVVVLACLLPPESPIYSSWARQLTLPCTIVSGYDLTWIPPSDTGIIVTPQHYEEPEVTILRRAVEAGIPILVIADGILEYRNTWANPTIVPGSIFQPVLAHKLAAIGASQVRVVEAWGNSGKCELVGAPRLDDLLGARPRATAPDATFRILVTTARTPGFTAGQTALVTRSLLDLKTWFDAAHGRIGGRPVEILWRLTGGLAETLGVTSVITETLGIEFHDLLRQVDALVTTPSTTMLEGMLCGIPVAMLDYTNSPTYVPPAWAITSRDHLNSVLPDLLAPPAPRMLFQKTTLHDALACRSPAAPRMVRLVEEMVRISEMCRRKNVPLCFPDRILPGDGGAPVDGMVVPWPAGDAADRVELEHLRRYAQTQDERLKVLEAQARTTSRRSIIDRLLGARRKG